MQQKWQTRCVSLLAVASALLLIAAPARAQDSPDIAETVRGHFEAILAEEYVEAGEYFSAAFRRAFYYEERATIDEYFLTRLTQLESGYQILDARKLADPDRLAMRVTVEFADPDVDAAVTVAERMHYYLIHEKAEPDSPLIDASGWAWRIDIYDALSYDTLAEARRRPYLYTREMWPEDESRELVSRQGLFRIQQALSRFYSVHGQYPFRLLGSDNRRDELVGGGFLLGQYPRTGFGDRPMKAEELGKKSSGDFAYYSVDADGNDRREGYWLLLHGKVADGFYFEGHDIVYILSDKDGTQGELAGRFAAFWPERSGQQLTPAAGLLALEEAAAQLAAVPPPWTEQAPAVAPDAPPAGEEVLIGAPPTEIEQLQPAEIGAPREVEPAAEEPAPAEPEVVEPPAIAEIPSVPVIDEPVPEVPAPEPEDALPVPEAEDGAAPEEPVPAGEPAAELDSHVWARARAYLAAQALMRPISLLAEPAVEPPAEVAEEPEAPAPPEVDEQLTVYSYGF